MSIKKKNKVLGLAALAVGIGIILAIVMPPIGWLVITAIGLVIAGIFLIKN